MIAGLDSSDGRPSPAQAAAAYAAGVRLWGGYLGTRPGLGLASLWDKASFDVVLNAGMVAIAYCSGLDDPAGVRALADAWGVLLGVDVEPGIRDDGPWVPGFLRAAAPCGLYGLASVHYQTGEPVGRGAAWNVVANYPGFDPGATWVSGLPPPAAPHGWQWQGTHTEFGVSVDSMWLEDAVLSLPQVTDVPIIIGAPNRPAFLLDGRLWVGIADAGDVTALQAAGVREAMVSTALFDAINAAQTAVPAVGTVTTDLTPVTSRQDKLNAHLGVGTP